MKKHLLLTAMVSGLLLSQSCSEKEIVLNMLWETDNVFLGPESIVYDSDRHMLYVSNVNVSEDANGQDSNYVEYISKVDPEGNIIDLKWIENVNRPTGITIHADKLYVTTRFALLIIDIEEGRVEENIEIPDAGFPNDVTVDDEGVVYMTDSGKKRVYRIENGIVENWLTSDELAKPNGILYDGGKLIIGVNSDNYLKSIDIQTKEITNIAFLDEGTIDGIIKYGDDFLVSHVMGNIYFVTKEGEVKELLNTREEDIRHADLGFIESERIIISPVLNRDKLIAFQF